MRPMGQFFKICILSVLLCAFLVSASSAQILTGRIQGTIADEEGTGLPGATVELSSPVLLGGIHSQITTEKGNYRFINLPPGMYKLVVKLDGFQTVERVNLRVMVNSTTTEDIVLKQAALETHITITAESPLVDITKSGLSVNYDMDQIEKVPLGREGFYDIVKQAPGFQSGGAHVVHKRLISAFGSNIESSSFQVDGVELTLPDVGFPDINLHQEAIGEVEIGGIGASAEYGSFTGAVVNIVTRSGGNKFNGSLAYYGQFDKLTGDNNPDPEEYFSFHRESFFDGSVTLGGPILKDKLWFFTTYNHIKDEYSSWQTDPDYVSPFKRDLFLAKFSAQIGKRHKLSGTFLYNEYFCADPSGVSTAPEVLGAEKITVNTFNAMYTWMLSQDAFLDFKYSYFKDYDVYMPEFGGSIHSAPHIDLITGYTFGGPVYPWEYWPDRQQAHASLSYFADDFLAGNHEFKVGIQYNRGSVLVDGGYGDGKLYLDYAGEPYLLYEQDPWYYGAIVKSFGAFFDDSWSIGDRLTLHLGLRYDHHSASYPELTIMDGWTKTSETLPASDTLIEWNSISPRFGLAYSITSDNKTVFRVSGGRYYDYMYSSNFNYPGPAVTDWSFYVWNGTQFELFWTDPGGDLGFVIDPQLKGPYADQLQVGIEREIFPDFSFGLSFLYKKEKDLIGYENKGGIYERINVVSPDNGETYLVYNQLNVGENEYWITNPADFEQTYKSVILSFNKRYSNNWQLNASLMWSKADSFNQAGHGVRESFAGSAVVGFVNPGYGKDPNDWINAKGAANMDRRWMFKMSASYNFPWEILVSFYYNYVTGRPIPTFVRVQTDQGMKQILAEPRGSERFDSIQELDLRLEKSFSITGSIRISAMLDVFNLLNSNTARDYYSYNSWSDLNWVPSSILFPRRAQIGVRLSF